MSTYARHIDPTIAPVFLREDLHPYLHGGGFGVATEILADSFWAKDLLERLEPSRFHECARILEQHDDVLNAYSAKQITMVMENSAVTAVLAQLKTGYPIPIEWDIWLDPEEPASLEKATIAHGSLAATLFAKSPTLSKRFLQGAPSVLEWIAIYTEAAKKSGLNTKLTLCLDIKSSWSTSEDINLFIRALKEKGIEVLYVGSFSYKQIKGVQIGGVKGTKKILFCHAVCDLKKKVASHPEAKHLMLNGADLLDASNLRALRDIAQSAGLQIGIYVQEPEAGSDAIKGLIEMVNQEPDLFSLGFALGNSRQGLPARMIQGSGAGVQKFLLSNNVRLIKRIGAVTILALFIIFVFSLYFRKINFYAQK